MIADTVGMMSDTVGNGDGMIVLTAPRISVGVATGGIPVGIPPPVGTETPVGTGSTGTVTPLPDSADSAESRLSSTDGMGVAGTEVLRIVGIMEAAEGVADSRGSSGGWRNTREAADLIEYNALPGSEKLAVYTTLPLTKNSTMIISVASLRYTSPMNRTRVLPSFGTAEEIDVIRFNRRIRALRLNSARTRPRLSFRNLISMRRMVRLFMA